MEIAVLAMNAVTAATRLVGYINRLDKTVAINDAKIDLQSLVLELQGSMLTLQGEAIALQDENRRLKVENDNYRQNEERHLACRAEKALWVIYNPTPGVSVYTVKTDREPETPYLGATECFCRQCADQHDRKSVFQKSKSESYTDTYTCPACGFSFTVDRPSTGGGIGFIVPMQRSSRWDSF